MKCVGKADFYKKKRKKGHSFFWVKSSSAFFIFFVVPWFSLIYHWFCVHSRRVGKALFGREGGCGVGRARSPSGVRGKALDIS